MWYQASKSMTTTLFFILLFNITLHTANAAEHSQAGLSIGFLRETSMGVLVGFTPMPNDCVGGYEGANAFMSRSAPQFKETLIRLKSAELLGVPVIAYYADIGDCADMSTLLQLSNIEVQ